MTPRVVRDHPRRVERSEPPPLKNQPCRFSRCFETTTTGWRERSRHHHHHLTHCLEIFRWWWRLPPSLPLGLVPRHLHKDFEFLRRECGSRSRHHHHHHLKNSIIDVQTKLTCSLHILRCWWWLPPLYSVWAVPKHLQESIELTPWWWWLPPLYPVGVVLKHLQGSTQLILQSF